VNVGVEEETVGGLQIPVDFFVTMNEGHPITNLAHYAPNSIDFKLRRGTFINILPKVNVAEFHVDKIMRRVRKCTEIENRDYVFAAVLRELLDYPVLILDHVDSNCGETFGQFTCKYLPVTLISC